MAFAPANSTHAMLELKHEIEHFKSKTSEVPPHPYINFVRFFQSFGQVH
jgi:hypothetical protein